MPFPKIDWDKVAQSERQHARMRRNSMENQAHTHKNENPDSIEISTPAKGGAIKVYHTADDIAGFKKKISAMFEVRDFANAEMNKRGSV